MRSEHSAAYEDLCVLYYAKELKGPEKARFEAHKKGCPVCQDLLLALEGAGRAAGAAAFSLTAGRLEDLAGRILGEGAGAEEKPAPARAPAALRRAWGFCTVLAAFAFGLYISTPGRFSLGEAPRAAALESDIARLSEEIGGLAQTVEMDGTGMELEADIQTLEDFADRMRRKGSGA